MLIITYHQRLFSRFFTSFRCAACLLDQFDVFRFGGWCSARFSFFWLDLKGREEGIVAVLLLESVFYGIEQYPSFERLISITYITIFEV